MQQMQTFGLRQLGAELERHREDGHVTDLWVGIERAAEQTEAVVRRIDVALVEDDHRRGSRRERVLSLVPEEAEAALDQGDVAVREVGEVVGLASAGRCAVAFEVDVDGGDIRVGCAIRRVLHLHEVRAVHVGVGARGGLLDRGRVDDADVVREGLGRDGVSGGEQPLLDVRRPTPRSRVSRPARVPSLALAMAWNAWRCSVTPPAVTAVRSADVSIGWSARVDVAAPTVMASASDRAAPALMVVRFTCVVSLVAMFVPERHVERNEPTVWSRSDPGAAIRTRAHRRRGRRSGSSPSRASNPACAATGRGRLAEGVGAGHGASIRG